ncbi:MAG: hypothetical protein AVDCRST_MAG66-3844, partial [uncultured Pseudonocardia sp.]
AGGPDVHGRDRAGRVGRTIGAAAGPRRPRAARPAAPRRPRVGPRAGRAAQPLAQRRLRAAGAAARRRRHHGVHREHLAGAGGAGHLGVRGRLDRAEHLADPRPAARRPAARRARRPARRRLRRPAAGARAGQHGAARRRARPDPVAARGPVHPHVADLRRVRAPPGAL